MRERRRGSSAAVACAALAILAGVTHIAGQTRPPARTIRSAPSLLASISKGTKPRSRA